MASYNTFYLVRFTCFVVLKLFCRFRVVGRDNIPRKGSFIVASNHKSYLDPPAVGVAIPQVVHFMASDYLFNGLFGYIMRKVATYPVRRGERDVGVIKESLKLLKKGDVIGVFPEGRRIEGPGFGEPALGVGMLAAHSGVPVLPVFVKGSDEALPKHAKFINFRPVEARIGKPLRFEGFGNASSKKEAYQLFSNKVMESIAQLKGRDESKN